MNDLHDPQYKTIIKQIIRGKVVPLLGAGVNLCDRPEDECFNPEDIKVTSSLFIIFETSIDNSVTIADITCSTSDSPDINRQIKIFDGGG